MKRLIAILSAAGLLTAAGVASAEPGTHDPGVNARQARQQGRIHQGATSGELTHEEARTLRQEQRAIRRQERAAKSDGTLTGKERKELHQSQNQASRNIYEEKHDAEKR